MNAQAMFDPLLEQYFDYLLHEKNFSQHTVLAYRNDFALFLAYLDSIGYNCPQYEESLDLNAVWPTAKELRGYLYFLNQRGDQPRSIGRRIASLKSFHKFLNRKQMLKVNPTAFLFGPKVHRQLPYILAEQEIETMLSSELWDRQSGDKEDASDWIDSENVSRFDQVLIVFIIEMIYGSGMRVSEMVSLRVEDIHKDEAKILGKGNKERLVYLSHGAQEMLPLYLAERKQVTSETGPLLVSRFGRPISSRTVRHLLKKWQQALHLEKRIYPHLFRHSFATHLLNHGCSLRAVQELLGHSSLSSTQVYLHLSKENIRETYDKYHPHH